VSETLREIVFIIVVMLANIVQAITGFAGTALAMPFSILLIGMESSRLLLNIVALVSCFFIVAFNRKDVDWKTFLIMTSFALIGMAIGSVLMNQVSSPYLIKFYGSIICLVAIYYLFRKTDQHWPTVILIGLVILAGIIHRLFLSGGPLIILYATQVLKQKNRFRATLAMVWIVLNGLILSIDLQTTIFTPPTLSLLLLAVLTIPVSVIIGKMIFDRINPTIFLKLTYGLLFISGVAILL